MIRRCRQLAAAVVFIIVMTLMYSMAASASDDNSLADLGIRTQGAVVSPEFRYDIWEYTVEVPAGTKTLELEPHTTNPNATVNSVTGTELAEDGTGRVVITVTSESGNAIEYVLSVSAARESVDPAAAIAANENSAGAVPATEVVLQSEVETEDPRYVKVDRNSLQDAENTIEKLQKTITEQRSHISMLTYVLYGLIAVSIIFLFIVISQLLRRRDIAQELAFYRQADELRQSGGRIAEDGWGDWGEDDIDRSSRKKNKKRKDADDGDWDDGPEDSAVSWTSQQVGTPVRPQNHTSRNVPNTPARQDVQRHVRVDETRRYEAVQHQQQAVPRDVTKDLNRVNKAEAKAMKKAAAAEAKREAQMRKAELTRAEEARRQAQEAERIAKDREAARIAQENALRENALRENAVNANDADNGKNVEINMVDL